MATAWAAPPGSISSASSGPTDLDVETLLSAIPDFNPDKSGFSSYEIEGIMPGVIATPYPFKFGWSRKKGSALIITTSDRSIPLFWSVGGRTLFCDSFRDRVSITNTTFPCIGCEIGDRSFKPTLAFAGSGGRASINIEPLISSGATCLIKMVDDVIHLVVTSTERSIEVDVTFSNGDHPRLLALKEYSPDKPETIRTEFRLTSVNEPLSAELQRLPRNERLLTELDPQIITEDDDPALRQAEFLRLAFATTEPWLRDWPVTRQTERVKTLVGDTDWQRFDERFDQRKDILEELLRAASSQREPQLKK